MLKHTALILGLGLSLCLSACAQTSSDAPIDESKVETPISQSGQGSEGRRSPRGGDRGHRTPPEAAFAACASLAAESSCSFETPRGTRTGVCRTLKGKTRAVCFSEPPRRPRRQGQ